MSTSPRYCPRTRSLIACALPLYAHVHHLVPVIALNSSPPRCPVVPFPDEPFERASPGSS